jgi:hypothetical protein
MRAFVYREAYEARGSAIRTPLRNDAAGVTLNVVVMSQ